jgi:hypothetical protein
LVGALPQPADLAKDDICAVSPRAAGNRRGSCGRW